MKYLFLIVCWSSLLVSDDGGFSVSFLPQSKLVPSLTASGTEHRISYNKQLTRGTIIGSMGGIFPLANISIRNYFCQVSAASSVYTSLQSAGVKFKVTNVDFFVDIFFDIPVSPETVFRTGWGHTSHHLADDAVGPGIVPINYARDYYSFYAVQTLPFIAGTAYAGVQWTYSFLIDRNIGRKILPQAGGEINFFPLTHDLTVYGALDLKLHGERRYGSTQSYQVGMKTETASKRAARIAYTYRTGVDERGQFYDRRNDLHLIGLYFDF